MKIVNCKRCAGKGYLLVGTMEDRFPCHKCNGTGKVVVHG